jgi:hypothetical protein
MFFSRNRTIGVSTDPECYAGFKTEEIIQEKCPEQSKAKQKQFFSGHLGGYFRKTVFQDYLFR